MRRLLLSSFYLSLSLLLLRPVVSAQVSLTNGLPSYTQNFDAMGAGLALPANWRMVEQSSTPTWAAGVTAVTEQASSGTPVNGGTYNWGSTAGERAIGAMTSAAFISPNSALCYFTNGGTTNITDLVFGYKAERYRTNTALASIQFYYSLDGVNWTSVPLADVPTSSFPVGPNNYQFNPPNAIINISGITITGLAIAPGSDFYFRWNFTNTGDVNSQGIGIDDVNVTATFFSPTNIITTGAVTGAPFTLLTCALPGAGTVDFSFTGSFNPGNVFTAQLSDDIGSFAAPVAIGTLLLSGTDPGLQFIPIVIPPGTVSGTGYLIRVISSNPATTGTSSAPFQIIQLGACASSHTDFYQSKQTGDWATLSTWESHSTDNPTWIPATLIPTYLANTISILNTHTVTLTSSQTVDQVMIESGGILENNMPVSNKLTVANGTGDDIDIKPGGIYLVTSGQTNASNFLINAGATMHIENTGTIQIGTGGAVGGGNNFYGFTPTSFVWDGGSIFLWNSTTSLGMQVTFFPDAVAGTIPILRITANQVLPVGGGTTATVVKGRLETTVALNFQGNTTKTFRDGIINSATIDGLAGASAKFIINGGAPILGGTGSITTPTNGIDVGPSSTVSLTSDKTITGKIQLLPNNSLIVLGSNNLTVTNSVTNTNPDISSYIKTNGTGKFQLNGVTGFPVGKLFVVGNSTINPVYIFSTTTANYAVRVVEPLTPSIYDPLGAVNRTWYITCSVVAPGAIIAFGYTFPGDCGINYNNAGPVELGVYVSPAWNRHQTGLTPTAFPFVTGTFAVVNTIPINVFNGSSTEFPFAIGNNGAFLPLDYFIVAHAQKINNNGIISWKIFSTDNISNFEVQRSVNGSGFSTIAVINPVANQMDYSYSDPSLTNGTHLYRIKVNRSIGGEKYSNTVALINGTKNLLITSMSPNPVHDQAVITLSAAKQGGANFEVYDIVGKKVKSWVSTISDGNNLINVDMSKLPAGVYHIMAYTPEARAVYRFVKQ